jgi:ankyrin repeat protein
VGCGFNNDVEAIKLLVRNGAIVDDPAVPDETPFLAAVKVSHFGPAETFLQLGADVNAQGPKGMTALHYMLKKQSE